MQHFITPAQYLMGREKAEPITELQYTDMARLLYRVGGLVTEVPEELLPNGNPVSSGYRPPDVNKKAGGSPRSCHLSCQAVDIVDLGGKLGTFLAANEALLAKYQLWLESPKYTSTWVHLQTRPTTKRVFIP